MFRYWNRIVNMSELRLPKIIFNWMREQVGDSWVQEIKSLFVKFGIIEKFYNLDEVELFDISNNLAQASQNIWLNNVQDMPKLRNYKLFKNNYEVEPYVLCFLNREKRSLVAQLRSGILPLQVEVGRWQGIPIEERICPVCNLNQVEDECHFLFECNNYYMERMSLYTKLPDDFENLSVSNKLNILMSRQSIHLFSEYLVNLYKKRQSVLYM